MRIVAGKYRGRRLSAPDGTATRPSSDRTRESLFNILEAGKLGGGGLSLLPGARVLDAFAGTGALGLEALSRGAADVTFVENFTPALNALKRNLANLEAEDRCHLIEGDVLRLARAPAAHGIALLDPPYNQGLAEPALLRLAEGGWLAEGAIVAVELMKSEDFTAPAGFAALDERIYGMAKLIFLHYSAG
ncbi:MAG: 16S rRNA (guanine(966)-N(2))-methyltransferase RsmD [Rhodovibrionaceae bacterium]